MKFNKIKLMDILTVGIIVSLLIITITGILSYSTNNTYTIVNQYGDKVEIFGNGIYKHDSAFKAPIFIGTDFSMLIFTMILIFSYILNKKHNSLKTNLFLTSIIGVILYYATSITFGVTYNFLYLIYVFLFSSSFFALSINIKNLSNKNFSKSLFNNLKSTKLTIFLALYAFSPFVAWLPDIFISLVSGNSLELIGVYTTEITYALDMGIISPLIISNIYLLKKEDSLGVILMSILLTFCIAIGIIVFVQTIFQISMGIFLPLGVLITKVGIFTILSTIALYYLIKLYRKL